MHRKNERFANKLALPEYFEGKPIYVGMSATRTRKTEALKYGAQF